MMNTFHAFPSLFPTTTRAPRLSGWRVAALLVIGVVGGLAAMALVVQMYPIH